MVVFAGPKTGAYTSDATAAGSTKPKIHSDTGLIYIPRSQSAQFRSPKPPNNSPPLLSTVRFIPVATWKRGFFLPYSTYTYSYLPVRITSALFRPVFSNGPKP